MGIFISNIKFACVLASVLEQIEMNNSDTVNNGYTYQVTLNFCSTLGECETVLKSEECLLTNNLEFGTSSPGTKSTKSCSPQ